MDKNHMEIGMLHIHPEEPLEQELDSSEKAKEVSKRPTIPNSRKFKKVIFLFIIVGILVGSFLGISRNLGLFTAWEKIPNPPNRAQKLFARGLDFSPLLIQAEGNQVYELHYISDWTWEDSSAEFNSVPSQFKKLPCNLSTFPFSFLKRKFSVIADCSEVVVPGRDFVPQTQFIFVLDQDGTIWVWMKYLDLATCLPFYIGAGAFLGLFAYVFWSYFWRATQRIKTRVKVQS